LPGYNKPQEGVQLF
jgi:Protein of unknown function (DUF3309)